MTVSLAPPIALPSASAAAPKDPAPPPNAIRIHASRDADWARAFPKAKNFVVVQIPQTNTLVLFWRIGKTHKAKELPPEEDYAGNYVQRVDLVVGPETIAFGDIGGSVAPPSQSCCARADLPSYVTSSVSVGTMQGDSELMIVRDASTLHVLHRETSDGRCDEAKQGPLDVCEGFEWERRAEIHTSGDPVLYERVDEAGEPFDCNPARGD